MNLSPPRNLLPAADLPAPSPDAVGGPLPGSVTAQFIQCGKPVCRCRAGRLHGPYFYRTWRDGPRTHKVYVKAADLAQVRARCARHHDIAQDFRALCVCAEALAARLRAQVARSRRLRAALALALAGTGKARGR